MYKIYCDMDGVLTDFDNQFKKYTGVFPDVYMKTHSTPEFWAEIEKAGLAYWVGIDCLDSVNQYLEITDNEYRIVNFI